MALQSKIPPQAYTRDTLVKAIEWLSGQPPAVRERANSADLIVSHYLQARRHSTTAFEQAPVSQEHFKTDLKHLAEDLKQFEEPSAPPPLAVKPAPQPARPSQSYVMPVEEQLENIMSHHRQENLFRQEVRQETVMRQESRLESPRAGEMKGSTWAVDARSLQIARDLQERLNLSSEAEALRMLVTMGAERVRSMF